MVSVLLEPISAFRDAESDYQSRSSKAACLIENSRPLPLPTRSKIQASFLIARPPPKPSLCLTPKLLLQFQQLTNNDRSRSVMEIWQPSIRKSKLTRGFYQRPKLRSGDIYATYNEPYTIDTHNLLKQMGISTHQHEKHLNLHKKDAAAVICHSTRDKTRASMISFRNEQCTWRVSALSAAHAKRKMRYRFTIEGLSRNMSMQWEKRLSDGGESASTEGEYESEYFALCFIDHEAQRKSRIATMTQSRLDIRVRKSSIIEHLQKCVDLTGSRVSGCESSESLEAWLYTHVLTMGTWVAHREGWLNRP